MQLFQPDQGYFCNFFRKVINRFKSQGLFLDKNKALMEWKKAGLDIIQTGAESDQTEAESKKTGVETV